MWIRNGIISTITTGVSVLILIVVLPALSRILTKNDFSFLTIVLFIYGAISIFDLGLGRYNAIFYATNRDPITLLKTVNLALVGGTIGTIIYLIIIFNLTENLYRNAYLILGIGIIPTGIAATIRGYYEGLNRFYKSNAIKFSLNIPILLIPLFLYEILGLYNVLYLIVLSRLLILILLLIDVSYKVKFFDLIEYKEIILYGLWALTSSIVAPILMYSDRLIVIKNLSYESITLYSIPHEYIPKMVLLTTAFSTALLPFFSINNNNNCVNAKKEYMRILKYSSKILIIAYILMGVGFSIYIELGFGHELLLKMTYLIPIFILASYVNSLATISFNYLLSLNRIKYISIAHTIELIVYIPILLIFYWLMGIYGAALAYLIRNIADMYIMNKGILSDK